MSKRMSPPLILLALRIPRTTGRFEDIAGEAAPIRDATINVLFVATSSMEGRGRQIIEGAAFANTGRLASMERPIKSALGYLLACRSLTSSPVDVEKGLWSLAAASDMESVEGLVSAHAEKLAEIMCEVRTHTKVILFEPPPKTSDKECTKFVHPIVSTFVITNCHCLLYSSCY